LRRREFITLVGGAAAVTSFSWPIAARAQQAGKLPTIGFLGSGASGGLTAAGYAVFVAELRKLGFTEGENLIIDSRRTDEGAAQVFATAAELVHVKADVLVALGPEITLKAAVAASRTIPIVMIAVNYDPVAGGYVGDIARPKGNVTGLVFRAPELAAKQLELLVEAFPDANSIAVLWDSASDEQFNAAQRSAETMHITLRSHKLENPPYDFEAAFGAIAQDGARMLLVLSGPLFAPQRAHIAALAIQHRLPTMFTFNNYVEAGGLMSYGIDIVPIFRRAASFVAKILRGAKPSDLPVEQPTSFEFALNLKTAKAIGVTLPTSILLRADEVIE
jgi:putative ABC transport system substrate-binding protein